MSREAMKLALEALQYCWSDSYNTNGYKARELSNKAIIALKQALSQPEPEPVAVVSGYYGGKCVVLPTDPARIFNSGTAFYTHPPKREPLTDEQMEQIHQQYGGNIKKIMRAVEAAHGIAGEA